MNMSLKYLVSSYLENAAEQVREGKCEISLEQAEQILGTIAHEPLSKAQAYEFLNMSRSKFDSMVKDGKLPQGRKRKGFNELVWYKDELLLKCQ